MNTGSTSPALRNIKRFRAVSYTLVFLLMACASLTLSILIHHLVPHWHAGIMAGIWLFIVIDRLYTYRQLKSLTYLSSEWAIALGAQWIVIILFTRFLLSYAYGPQSLITDLSLLARGAIVQLFTPEYVITLLLAFALWVLTALFLQLLDEVGLDLTLALQDDPPLVQNNTVPTHQRMVSLIFTIGIVLVILTAITRLDLQTNASNSDGLPSIALNRFSGAEAGALLYFVFGLALLSVSRLMSLQTHWNRLRIPVSSTSLPGKWTMYSLFFLLILAMVVSVLPAGDSIGFFAVVRTLFSFLIAVFVFLAQVIIVLLLFVFSLPFLFLGKAPPGIFGSRPPPLPPLPTQPETGFGSIPPILELVRSILLWSGLVFILVYALIRFAGQHESILAALRKSRVANWLALAWQWLYRNVDKARGSLSRAITDGWQGILARLDGKRALPPPGWVRLRSLDPRRRVYFFYLAMIRRGDEQGLRREPSQTPSEYAAKLEKAIPSSTEDIDAITEAFVRARYSRHEVSSHDANIVKITWERIRRELQSRSRGQ